MVTDAAEEVIDPWRRRFDASAVARRIPSHVTILFPLVAAVDVDDTLLARLRALYAPYARFAYELARVETFPGVAWLAPEPATPFDALITRTRAAYPEQPPYGDPMLEPVPHCTVGVADTAQALDAMTAALRSELGPLLPIHGEAHELTLLEEHEDGAWSTRATFPFEGRG